ncbi:hypothetical protein FACS1894123_05280 [Bacteroidia bacterium]|nr:hypothetical protein FACS1894123_05280 [Bacteroidia bacterium]
MTTTKVVKSSQTITPFAGISFINDEIFRCGFSSLIDSKLGYRQSTKGFTHSDIVRAWFNIFLCGGEVAEDIQEHLRQTLENIPGNKVPSADTLLCELSDLAADCEEVTSSTGNSYKINVNEKLLELNIEHLQLLNILGKGEYQDLDFDNQILAHEKWDAKKTYKMNTGYFPGIATIGKMIVYLENRDGNANVKIDQSNLLERCYQMLAKYRIFINRSRMDAGSYSKEIIDVVSKYSKLFYIRANRSGEMTKQIRQITDWQRVEINYKEYEVASIPFKQFFEDRNYRLVVAREISDNQQLDLFDGKFKYRCILTNDHESTEVGVIEYYNQRGESESNFDVQNNDFGWSRLPTSDMDSNTVFLILTSMLKNFYTYLVKNVARVFKNILPTTRLKRFIFRFICVAGKWTRSGRQNVLKLYTDRPYERLQFAA